MHRDHRFGLFVAGALLSLLLSGGALCAEPPIAAQRPVVSKIHGEERIDPYAWLREKENPEVIAYLEAENAYTAAMTGHLEGLQQRVYDELLGRLLETDTSVPVRHGGYWYYYRTEEGLDYPVWCRRAGTMEAAEQVLIDGNALTEELDLEYFQVTSADLDPSHTMLAFSVDTTGYETVDVWVQNLATGEVMRDVLRDVSPWGLAWGGDGQTLYYTRFDASKRPDRVYRHRLGSDPSGDELVAREDDVRFSIGVGRTRSDALVVIQSGSTTTSEVWILDSADGAAQKRSVAGRTPGVRYSVEHAPGQDGGWLYVTTDDGAPNYKVIRKRLNAGPFEAWGEVIAHDPETLIQSIDVFSEHLVVSERREGLRKLRVLERATGGSHTIEMPEEISVIGMGANPDFETGVLRLNYQSPITPNSVYDYDIASRSLTLLKRDVVPSGHTPEDYVVYRRWAVAPDGTRIPVTIAYRKGIHPDGTAPCLLYAYGSYGASMDPWYSNSVYPFIDRGVVYAVAHVRGGGEMGRHWKEEGRLERKPNTFTDFIACAEMLIEEGYAHPERLAIEGGSAGGLLIGAVINMRPDLFCAAHAAVPFVDVVNTMLDASIPLTTGEYEEWGNPNDPESYAVIRSYSPYDNVRAQAYPNLLITAGLNDPRVHYWEPAKWAALLRAKKTCDNLLLLKTNMGAGHGGASGRYGRYEEVAFEIAFLLDQLGAPEVPLRETE